MGTRIEYGTGCCCSFQRASGSLATCLGGFGTDGGSLADLSLETRLDAGY